MHSTTAKARALLEMALIVTGLVAVASSSLPAEYQSQSSAM